jgi:hypothetical protein
MAAFSFERQPISGNYECLVPCNHPDTTSFVTKVTVHLFRGKPYVDIRDHYKKEAFPFSSSLEDFAPTKRGVTFREHEWHKLVQIAPQISENLSTLLDAKKIPDLPIPYQVSDYLSVLVLAQKNPNPALQVALHRIIPDKPEMREISFNPAAWFAIFKHNHERISSMLSLLAKEDELAKVARCKQYVRNYELGKTSGTDGDRALFAATESIPAAVDQAEIMESH